MGFLLVLGGNLNFLITSSSSFLKFFKIKKMIPILLNIFKKNKRTSSFSILNLKFKIYKKIYLKKFKLKKKTFGSSYP